MKPSSHFRILLCADGASGEEMRPFLQKNGYEVLLHPLGQADPDPAAFHLVVVDGTGPADNVAPLCRRLRAKLGESFVPILYITDDPSPAARVASLECGADAYLLKPFEPAELHAQVQAFLRIKERQDILAEKSTEVHRINKRLQAAYQQIDQELDLARRIQESFLPQTLPEVPDARFAVKYQPCGKVGGDFYDVFRLDEHHFGFYVADAMGHGVPASLLTIFVKKGVRAKEIFGQQYRLVPPSEVLQRLNRDLIDQALSENPFITMVYTLFNFQKGTFQFARSGHPYPLYVPREGPPKLWEIEGSLLGVFETKYPMQTHELKPGDKVLLYTDGIDSASFEKHPVGVASLLAAAEKLRELPVTEFVDALARELFQQTKQSDDLSLLGLEFRGGM